MHYELGSLIVAGLAVVGAIAGAVKIVIRGELARFAKEFNRELDKRFESKTIARERHELVHERLTALERRRSV